MDQIIALAKNYSLATGIACRVLDVNNKEVWCNVVQDNACHFCTPNNKQVEQCTATHYETGFLTKNLADRFIYYCPLGFIFWSSPVIYKGKHLATIIAGSLFFNKIDKKGNTYKIATLTEEQLIALNQILLLSCQALYKDDHKMVNHNSFNSNQDTFFKKFLLTPQEKNLVEAIKMAHEEEALNHLNTITSQFSVPQPSNFYFLKNQSLRLMLLINRYLENGSQTLFNLTLTYLKELEKLDNWDQLKQWLQEQIVLTCQSVFKVSHLKHSCSIAKALRYCQKHYTQEISLEDAAKAACLSPTYFSRILKEETKLSWTEHLNQTRINESKKLLINTTLSLNEIAKRCGFTDQSYFSKIFKKLEDITPNHFRNKNWQKKA